MSLIHLHAQCRRMHVAGYSHVTDQLATKCTSEMHHLDLPTGLIDAGCLLFKVQSGCRTSGNACAFSQSVFSACCPE